MEYYIDTSIPKDEYIKYIETLTSKFYKVLCSYESCVNTQDFTPWHTYLDTMICEMIGNTYLFKDNAFVSLLATLIGLSKKEDLTAKKVKSIVLGSCNKLNRLKKDLGG